MLAPHQPLSPLPHSGMAVGPASPLSPHSPLPPSPSFPSGNGSQHDGTDIALQHYILLATDSVAATKSTGMLNRLTGTNTSRRRYVVLYSSGRLAYYKHRDRADLRGELVLSDRAFVSQPDPSRLQLHIGCTNHGDQRNEEHVWLTFEDAWTLDMYVTELKRMIAAARHARGGFGSTPTHAELLRQQEDALLASDDDDEDDAAARAPTRPSAPTSTATAGNFPSPPPPVLPDLDLPNNPLMPGTPDLASLHALRPPTIASQSSLGTPTPTSPEEQTHDEDPLDYYSQSFNDKLPSQPSPPRNLELHQVHPSPPPTPGHHLRRDNGPSGPLPPIPVHPSKSSSEVSTPSRLDSLVMPPRISVATRVPKAPTRSESTPISPTSPSESSLSSSSKRRTVQLSKVEAMKLAVPPPPLVPAPCSALPLPPMPPMPPTRTSSDSALSPPPRAIPALDLSLRPKNRTSMAPSPASGAEDLDEFERKLAALKAVLPHTTNVHPGSKVNQGFEVARDSGLALEE